MPRKSDVGVRFDWSICEGVEPVFVFDFGTGQFLVDVAMSEHLVKRDLEEQRISLAAASRCLERIAKLAWRMGEVGRPGAGGPQPKARTAPTQAAA